MGSCVINKREFIVQMATHADQVSEIMGLQSKRSPGSCCVVSLYMNQKSPEPSALRDVTSAAATPLLCGPSGLRDHHMAAFFNKPVKHPSVTWGVSGVYVEGNCAGCVSTHNCLYDGDA